MPYLKTYCESLAEQSYKDFSILLFNDGVSNAAVSAITSQYPGLNVSIEEVQGSIPLIRQIAINQLIKSDFENIYFIDTDDFVPSNYLEIKRRMLINYDIAVADLSIINQEGHLFKEGKLSSRLPDGFVIDQSFLYYKNIMGMSNTSIKKVILFSMIIPEDIIAVDWFIFFSLLKDKKAIFTNQTCTYYRQHGLNILGDNNISKEVLLRKTKAMIAQAKALAGNCEAFFHQLPALKKLYEELQNDDDKILMLQKSLLNTDIDYFWFEDISLLAKYDNTKNRSTNS